MISDLQDSRLVVHVFMYREKNAQLRDQGPVSGSRVSGKTE